MNFVIMHFASGMSFFSGILLLFSGLLTSFSGIRIFCKHISRWLVIIGVILIFLSSSPLSIWFVVPLSVFLAVQLIIGGDNQYKHILRVGVATTAGVLLVTVFFFELSHWFSPPFPNVKFNRVVILADSISAGIGFKGEVTWSDILKKERNLNVINKAVGGGTISSTIKSQVKVDISENDLVILEIGGNDLLSGTSSKETGEQLDNLLSSLKKRTSQIIMFELPLPPGSFSFARQQRELSVKYGIVLIPKRYMSKVLSGKESTVDGLHLSNFGQRKMADVVSKFIR